MEEYKRLILNMMEDLEESDLVFIRRIYTMMKHYIARKK
jgi:hypothetical protein